MLLFPGCHEPLLFPNLWKLPYKGWWGRSEPRKPQPHVCAIAVAPHLRGRSIVHIWWLGHASMIKVNASVSRWFLVHRSLTAEERLTWVSLLAHLAIIGAACPELLSRGHLMSSTLHCSSSPAPAHHADSPRHPHRWWPNDSNGTDRYIMTLVVGKGNQRSLCPGPVVLRWC